MTRLARIAAGTLTALALATCASHLLAQGADQAPYTVVESGRSYARLQQAIDAIGAGQGTIRFASLRFADCGVQKQGDVTYQAAVPGQSVFDGVACESKAALVLRGHSARIEGLVFANIHVPDKNGAGVRLEHGDLSVSQSWFRDSEQGILTGSDPAASVSIDKSTFTRLGTCEGSGCAHSIYIGNYGALSVTRSRFEAGTGGHYLKARAARVAILNNSFDDTAGRNTNYMIDLPDGATGRIAGNWFVQGRSKENYSAFIAVAAEHRNHSSNGLVVANNNARFGPGIDRRSAFVADWSGNAITLENNTLGAGLVRFDKR
ncbi:right-handed parallel beta-helix repeat-containing protein [Novosphingobium sp. 1949]|uniref:Right-handed parallel beta-helix repeat-containing protein n=1 Tax=Novosphingobium organovorum TaxID=2930092 RepID=A0ABT0BH21_9SPHN|nr:right-handed parallel beta-helix repeat-containing protein [Novosphingobium organovorum]MCJ2184081.1 right-handed parallel beta-helix repeat-containing protein [Novosphingobium organovorum]